jgi:methyl-accepting chemotaxis protein
MAMIQAEVTRVAEWQTFPWGTMLTFATTLAALMLAALINHLRKTFLTKDEANVIANSLRERIATLVEEIDEVNQGCEEANRNAREAHRLAELTDRSLGEQWRRVTEEIIQPVKEMSRDLRETREMVLRYIQTQDNHTRDIEKLERRMDGRREQ